MLMLNNKRVNVTRFPDQTSQVWQLENIDKDEYAYIEWDFDNETELFHLIQLVDLLRVEGVEHITLCMQFLPYGRQDKVVSNQTSFALSSFANVINNLKLDAVITLDAHNPELTEFLFDNFKNLFPYFEIGAVVKEVKPDVLCFPDKGAIRRYGKELAYLNKIHTYGDKQRDQLTGKILSYDLKDDVTDRDVLIIDDICDGGATFVHLAEALYANGAKTVNLYTTHGIYSKGLRPLKDARIGRIFSSKGEMSELHGSLTYKPYDLPSGKLETA
jgi:ribose-phosphate pyrophosphokinase